MLIKIDDTVTEYIESNKQNLNLDSLEIRALNNIAKAYQEGYHIVSASLDALEILAKLDLLEYNSQRTYHYLLSKFTFLPAYENYFGSYILVKSSNFDFYRNKTQKKKIIYEVPLNKFSKLQAIRETVLLAEDSRDCDFYEKLANKYISENKSEINVKLNFDPLPGGGIRSYDALKRKIHRESIVLAIADSDKSYPKDKVGETLSKLKQVYNEYFQTSIIDLHGLKVREKENLIPPSMYSMCCNSSGKDVIEKLEEIERLSEHQSKLMYLDIKEGIKAKAVKDLQYQEYFQELFEVIDLISCTLEEVAQKDNKDVLMMGIGGKIEEFVNDYFEDGLEKKLEKKKLVLQKKNIPEQVIKKIEQEIKNMEEYVVKKQNLVENLPDYLKNEWDELCHKIISWGCCDDHIA
ncbi:hypothetical protein [Bacillus cereus]|uniref:hypothetical protein n=1 Tax=Bacillus cereus TaxID=1396 RepID=UPI000BEC6316|nr:hypothetical protein [Bacillus cereus]MCU4862032.1 hypothetical protein [Bacillus cereus]PEG01147.1 hypothetical protein CON54_30775 [Bacillus cereus]